MTAPGTTTALVLYFPVCRYPRTVTRNATQAAYLATRAVVLFYYGSYGGFRTEAVSPAHMYERYAQWAPRPETDPPRGPEMK